MLERWSTAQGELERLGGAPWWGTAAAVAHAALAGGYPERHLARSGLNDARERERLAAGTQALVASPRPASARTPSVLAAPPCCRLGRPRPVSWRWVAWSQQFTLQRLSWKQRAAVLGQPGGQESGGYARHGRRPQALASCALVAAAQAAAIIQASQLAQPLSRSFHIFPQRRQLALLRLPANDLARPAPLGLPRAKERSSWGARQPAAPEHMHAPHWATRSRPPHARRPAHESAAP